jgi:hypothetical protein
MYGNGYSEYMDYSAIDALPNMGMVLLQGCLLEGQGIKIPILISWCRE